MANSAEEAVESMSAPEYARIYVQRVTDVLARLDYPAVGRFIEVLLEARRRGSRIFFLGNGGSAATASHFANDLGVCSSPEGRRPFRAISLTDNSAYVTCLANDFGYESIFLRQLRNLMEPEDVVVGISASGNSENVVQALQFAADNGGIPVAIVGFDGGKMKDLTRHVMHVETAPGEYGPVEDVHLVLDHLISSYLAQVAD